jgi:hypothetical protein
VGVERGVILACFLVLLFFGGVSALACYLAPTGQQWDAISYHLADPKVFLQQGRISVLPTEHHSNFPFTMEMLFMVGLVFGDFPLANLFHWMMGVLCVVAMVSFGRKFGGVTSGWLGAVLFVTTPVALWQASIAYIDVAVGLYVLLASFAGVRATLETEEKPKQQWLVLAGLMMGFALGVKYLALLPFLFLALFLLLRRTPVRKLAIYLVLAGAIASPWYLKNIVLMGNPVYPYMYKIFPKSRYWSEDRGRVYDSEQQGFGYSHKISQPAETVPNLLMTPWRLFGNADKFSNAGEYTFMALFGGLWAGLGLAFALLRRIPREVRWVMGLGLIQVLAWFFVAQVSRYLVSVLPLLGIGCGYVCHRLLFEKEAQGTLLLGQRLIIGGVLVGQVLVMLMGLLWIPTSMRTAMQMGVMPTVISIPDMIADISHPEGSKSRLSRTLETFAATEWINANTGKRDGVVLFEDTRGFYLDRPYLWGNGEHSSYIPYEQFRDGGEMNRWFREQGFRFALINLNWSSRKGDPEMPTAPVRLEREALQRWYVDTAEATGWRSLLADALRKGLWRVVFTERGVVIVEMTP